MANHLRKNLVPIILLILVFCFTTPGIAQKPTDSLWSIWLNPNNHDTVRLNSLNQIINMANTQVGPNALTYIEMYDSLAKKTKLKKYIATSYLQRGRYLSNIGKHHESISYAQRALKLLGDRDFSHSKPALHVNLGISLKAIGRHSEGLKEMFQGLKLYQEYQDTLGVAKAYSAIGNFYMGLNNDSLALIYHNKSLILHKSIGNKSGECFQLIGLADLSSDRKDYNQALKMYEAALKLADSLQLRQAKGVILNNMSTTYRGKGDNKMAQILNRKVLEHSMEIGDNEGVIYAYLNSGISWQDLLRYDSSIYYCQKAFDLAIGSSSAVEKMYACECLYKAYKLSGDYPHSLIYFEKYFNYKDSIYNKENAAKIARLETQYQYEKKATEARVEQEKREAIIRSQLKNRERERNGLVAGVMILSFFSIVVLRQRNKIKHEKKRSDDLLLNILPREVADELKNHGKSNAKSIEEVTILFSDFKEFTHLAERLGPEELVHEINDRFAAFDSIMEKYDIEKIKTIGDSYMAAGGLHFNNQAVKNTVLAAIEMQHYISTTENPSKIRFEMRLGIHTGQVVAGIVGLKKFQYDLWGDAVNTASRMESHGEVGMVNISRTTYELIKNDPIFEFHYRGKIDAKGKGPMDMWFVSLKPQENT